MKIGILTHTPRLNYGGILQAYALQSVLESMGHEVCIFDKTYIRKLDSFSLPFIYLKRLIAKCLFDKNKIIRYEYTYNKAYPIISQNIYPFVKNKLNRMLIDDLSSIKQKEIEAIIVGSDQIWRPFYFKKMWSSDIADAFLKFTKDWDIKRIAYAASFGVDFWEFTKNETIRCSYYANKFNGISVREKSGVNLCSKYLNVNCVHVLDPTLLLTKDDYISLVGTDGKNIHEGNLLVYILDESSIINKFVNKIIADTKLIPFYTNKEINLNRPNESIKVSVESWIKGFMKAELVITDSFHACVFSIIFNKPFYLICNVARGSERFKSLLNDLHIKYIEKEGILYPVLDYKKINQILMSKRNESIDFLKRYL